MIIFKIEKPEEQNVHPFTYADVILLI